MPQALDGVRVIDLTRMLAGPFCSMMLADMGAEVIKVEIPGKGDDARHLGPPFVNDESAFFLSINRNKKSVTLNLKKKQGKNILYNLVEKADVFIENFRPGVTERLDIDYKTLKQYKSDLIYASISGFGQTGPYKNKPGYNFTIQALSGVMTMTGEPNQEPTFVGISLGDIPAGIFAAYGISTALFKRAQTGEGEYIDVGMLDCLLSMMENPIIRYATTGNVPQAIGDENPSIAPFGSFQTKEGKIVIAIGNDKLWEEFCEALDIGELIEDPRFCNNAQRIKNRQKLREIIENKLKEKSAKEWVDYLENKDLPCAPINSVDQLFEDSQVSARDMIVDVDHPKAGKIKMAGIPTKLSNAQGEIKLPPPLLGEHNQEIYGNLLGFGEDEINQLKNEEVI